jgi:predicted dehydrogenase
MRRKLRMGMVGGGSDAFIGGVHRMAARLDDSVELTCGAFSSVRQKSLDSGKALGLPPDRVYGAYRDMIRREAKRPPEERIDFIAIVTPNNMHYPVAMAALDAGFHVLCDKPMTVSVDEAVNLQRKVEQNERLFCLTHNYTGYPMVKEARQLVQTGKLGKIRRVVVSYPQGWMATRVEVTDEQKQAMWRTNPRNAGVSCCMGDIGSHCHNLAEYMTGLEVTEVCADLNTFVNGRQLDDDGSVLLRFNNGARGVLWASQIAIGHENTLTIAIYGEKGSLQWAQEEPNTLIAHWLGKPSEIRRTGNDYNAKCTAAMTRLPCGHPEGFIEAFANVYRNFAETILRMEQGKKPRKQDLDFPTAADGVRGMKFVDAVVRSSEGEAKWVSVEPE